MAVGTVSAGGVSGRRDVLNGDTEGHFLISVDLQDGWLRWGEEKDEDPGGIQSMWEADGIEGGHERNPKLSPL